MKVLIIIGIILVVLSLSILSIILSDDGYAELMKKTVDDVGSDKKWVKNN